MRDCEQGNLKHHGVRDGAGKADDPDWAEHRPAAVRPEVHRVLEYPPERLGDLEQKLSKPVRDTLACYELKATGAAALPPSTRAEQRTIAVTGSGHADELAARRRIEDLLTPCLSDQTVWLVGSVRTVDLSSARFLVEHDQQVAAVGYNRFDCAPELREPVKKERETQVPGCFRGIAAPGCRGGEPASCALLHPVGPHHPLLGWEELRYARDGAVLPGTGSEHTPRIRVTVRRGGPGATLTPGCGSPPARLARTSLEHSRAMS
jgi:hypothetical protein